MLVLKKVAVTGGLSCGKTTVCHIFRELGAFVVSADEIVHRLLSSTTPIGRQVINLIGPNILIEGKIDRSLIAKQVFNHPKLLRKLEMILHPAVMEEINKLYEKINRERSAPIFIAEIPLFFESKLLAWNCDYVVAVIADPELCKARFLSSTQYDGKEYDKRMARQAEHSQKLHKADFVIRNDGNLDDLSKIVKNVYSQMAA